jgi:phosphoribosylanthranilate isomerase
VAPPDAAAIASALPPDVLKVAVFRRPSQDEVDEVLDWITPDLVQADARCPMTLPSGVELLPVYREGGALPDPGVMGLYEGPTSGNGARVDWIRARELRGRFPMVLAGGLDHGNVAEAIEVVDPFGVDVSSGVESAPGVKDPGLIAAFVAAARGGRV